MKTRQKGGLLATGFAFLKRYNFLRIDSRNQPLYTRVIFYVRRIGRYLYKYRIYGTISIYLLKGQSFVYQLI